MKNKLMIICRLQNLSKIFLINQLINTFFIFHFSFFIFLTSLSPHPTHSLLLHRQPTPLELLFLLLFFLLTFSSSKLPLAPKKKPHKETPPRGPPIFPTSFIFFSLFSFLFYFYFFPYKTHFPISTNFPLHTPPSTVTVTRPPTSLSLLSFSLYFFHSWKTIIPNPFSFLHHTSFMVIVSSF